MRTSLLIPLCLLLACLGARATEPLQIAAAANFRPTLDKILEHYEPGSDAQIRVSSAATGVLYAQIVNGARHDLLLAADSRHPALLLSNGLAVPGSQTTYAWGALALASRDSIAADAAPAAVAALLRASSGHIALANPDTAPYGLAAKHTLQHFALWESASRRRATAGNVAQAFQFFSTGNAEFAFIGLAQWRNRGGVSTGSVWPVPPALHPPLQQDAVLLTGGRNPEAAKRFLSFLGGAEARIILAADGYRTSAP